MRSFEVYVRQSTPAQVQLNRGSQRRQYLSRKRDGVEIEMSRSSMTTLAAR